MIKESLETFKHLERNWRRVGVGIISRNMSENWLLSAMTTTSFRVDSLIESRPQVLIKCR